MQKIRRALSYVAGSVESGYSALFTFGVKEILSSKERQALSLILHNLANRPELLVSLVNEINSSVMFSDEQGRMLQSNSSSPVPKVLQKTQH